jgi:sarcosine oxidase subunit beta
MNPIVIVGGGVVGTSIAYRLRNEGADVTLVEKGSLGDGATGDSMSEFAWHLNLEEPYRSICRRSWELYQRPLEEGFLNFMNGGFVAVADTEPYLSDLEEDVPAYEGLGIETRVLDPEDIVDYGLDPATTDVGGLYIDEGRFTDYPGYKIVTYFADEAARGGVDIHEQTRVTDVLTDDGTVAGVRTSSGTIEAGTVINAAGPWAPKLNDMVGVDLPLRHTQAPMIEYAIDEEVGVDKTLALITWEDGLYVVGGFPRQAWVGNAPHEGEAGGFGAANRQDADTTFNSHLGNDFRRAAIERIDAGVPALRRGTVTDEFKCMRTITPDHFPFAGGTSVDGFHVATGMNGQGITLGPAVGELLAEHLLTGETNERLNALSADRFD